MPHRALLDRLAISGFRRTKIRSALLRIFTENQAPLSVPEIMTGRPELGGVNKTTIYREVDFFAKQNILVTVILGDGKTRYELAGRAHHHHLVCEECGQVADVAPADNLAREIRRIKKDHSFIVRRHSLEFFGLCSDCL